MRRWLQSGTHQYGDQLALPLQNIKFAPPINLAVALHTRKTRLRSAAFSKVFDLLKAELI